MNDIERLHAFGSSNGYWHECDETGETTMAFPDTNGRLRCAECGAFCETNDGDAYVYPHPIAHSQRVAGGVGQ